MSPTRVLILYELQTAMRNRWLLAYGGIFTVLALGLSLIGLSTVGAVGLEGYGRTTASERNTFLLGRRVGALAAIGVATLLGFGLAGVLIGLGTGSGGGLQYLAFLGVALALGGVYLSIGTVIAVAVRSRLQGTAVALAVWFISVVLFDLVLIGAGVFAGASPQAMAAAVLLNPVEVARILALLVLDPALEVLGPVGGFLVSRLGTGGTTAVLIGALVAWLVSPLSAALALFDARDPL